MKKYTCFIFVAISLLLLTSFSFKPKPHLIVGNWGLIEKQKENTFLSKGGKNYLNELIAFSSDEITSSIVVFEKGRKNQIKMTFGFTVFEPFDEFKNDVLMLKNLCDDKTRLVFSIIKLDKETMQLKFEKEYSSDNIKIPGEILHFERTAGPPENMP